MLAASFHELPLLGALAALSAQFNADQRRSFVERLSGALDLKAALALYAVLHAQPARAGPGSRAPAGVAQAIGAEVDQLRCRLEEACASVQDGQALAPGLDEALQQACASADHQPLERYYLLQQRMIATHVTALRARVRALLESASAPLAELAGFDAVLEQGFAAREAAALARLPALLGEHCAELLARARDDSDLFAAAGEAGRPAQPPWLEQLARETQQLLRGEIDFRLMPVEALLEACREASH